MTGTCRGDHQHRVGHEDGCRPHRGRVQLCHQDQRERDLGDVEAEDVDHVGAQQRAHPRCGPVGPVLGRGGGRTRVQVDRPRQGRRDEIGDPGDGCQRLQCGGAARQGCGGEECAHAQAGVAQGAACGESGVAVAAVGDRGHESRVGGRPCLVADAEEERRRREQPDVPRRGGQQQRYAQYPHQHRRCHDRAACAPVQPSAHRGHAHQTHDDADRHGDAGGRRGQPQHRHPVEQQKGPQQAGAERVHGQGHGIAGASGGTDEGARLDLGGHGVNGAAGHLTEHVG